MSLTTPSYLCHFSPRLFKLPNLTHFLIKFEQFNRIRLSHSLVADVFAARLWELCFLSNCLAVWQKRLANVWHSLMQSMLLLSFSGIAGAWKYKLLHFCWAIRECWCLLAEVTTFIAHTETSCPPPLFSWCSTFPVMMVRPLPYHTAMPRITPSARDLRIVFLHLNRISNRIGRPIRFRIEFSNRIGRIYHASCNTV